MDVFVYLSRHSLLKVLNVYCKNDVHVKSSHCQPGNYQRRIKERFGLNFNWYCHMKCIHWHALMFLITYIFQRWQKEQGS